MELAITCACGWSTTGEEDAVVEATQDHGLKLHNMEVSREEALAMSSPAETSPGS